MNKNVNRRQDLYTATTNRESGAELAMGITNAKREILKARAGTAMPKQSLTIEHIPHYPEC